MLVLAELCLCLLIVPLAFIAPGAGRHFFAAIEHRVSRLAARRGLAVLAVFFLALGARLAVLPIEPVPAPGIHDEFSYLLMADTFAHGRLTNPTHPMWVHFETFHVNQQPTYCSKFFPSQGLFLALGQIVFGHPFWGVWLSTGLMCAAICWALQGWMPPGWAFLGGILAILRLGTYTYWANSYWGGSVAALGGALVLGALPRIKHHQRARDAVPLAIGLAILANSRPYEGLVYSVPILAALTIWSFRKTRPTSVLLRRVVLPIGMVLALTLTAMGYYFWKTTGSSMRTPYAVYAAHYDAAPFVPWQKVRSIPTYRHAVMQQFYLGFAMQQYVLTRDYLWVSVITRILNFWLFFVGPALSLPLFVVSCLLPYGIQWSGFTAKTRLLLLINLISFAALLFPVYFNLHYAAPMVCAGYALLLFSMRRTSMWDRKGRSKGKFLVRATVAVCVVMAAFRVSTAYGPWSQAFLFAGSVPTGRQVLRAQLLADLQRNSTKQLVIVRYASSHNPHEEWVYNDADIDGSKVVWAREMNAEENQKLLDYFKDRRAWLVEADRNPPKLEPYPTQRP